VAKKRDERSDGVAGLPRPSDAPPLGDTTRSPRVTVLLANPRGFCAGVRRAIDAVEEALEVHGRPLYVRRPIVHNLTVVRALEAKGAVFVQELDQVPEGGVVVLSAHGSAPEVADEAGQRGLRTYDAVCPLVAKVHHEVMRYHRNGRHVLLIGHSGHPEIAGTLARLPPGAATLVASADEVPTLDFAPEQPLGYAVQTTYSVDEAAEVVEALRSRFFDLAAPPRSDICYATTNRQAAVRAIAPRVDSMIVVGEHFSSNACRLREVAEAAGCSAVQLVAGPEQIDWRGLPDRDGSIGITAAASTPEEAVSGILDALALRYQVELAEVAGPRETTIFRPVRIG
jgi:4-hydroxy-3-methylbut-2-en-1-yl diphosphate reductase